MKISLKLKELRKKFGLKQVDLANSLRVSPQAVSKWERDENYPDIILLKQIASLFDVSVDYLLGVYDETRDVFEATVFCSSLNRFAEKGESLSAKELAQWTGIIFHHMTEIVLQLGGIPVKYTGDGFLCFFSGSGHAARAVEAAQRIERLNRDKDLVVFLNSGEIYFGMVGHPEYASRDIYGDTVNKSFLLMDSFAKQIHRGIGLTEETGELLKKHDPQIKLQSLVIPFFRERDTYSFKNEHEMVVYQV